MLISEIPGGIRMLLANMLTTCIDRLEHQRSGDPLHRPIPVPGFRQLYHFHSEGQTQLFIDQMRDVRAELLPELTPDVAARLEEFGL